ncbi:MAG: SPFH/Band 7/PHB domain protein [Candidatus Aenigmarchaeota archaeon]|nr:SPFH/Band 7/PHB domain protein [Candidatus Aenigmarchaeota archaeon]
MGAAVGLGALLIIVITFASFIYNNFVGVALGIIFLLIYLASSFKTVRPTQRGLVERFGKYIRFLNPGYTFVFPFVDQVIKVNVTEQMVDAEKQEIITSDRLNATVDAQVYFKVEAIEDSVKKSQYNVHDYTYQIVNLAKTTLRNIIGTLTYEVANSDRTKINTSLHKILTAEAKPWGLIIVRTEIKEIEPPSDVQTSMNTVIMAENEKKAATDKATANERIADGERRAEIMRAEGDKKSKILRADGEAEAIKTVANANAEKYKVESESLKKHFTGNAVVFKKLVTTEKSLKNATKFVIDPKLGIQTIISEAAGITPIKRRAPTKKK